MAVPKRRAAAPPAIQPFETFASSSIGYSSPEPRRESRSYFLPMQIGIIGGTGHEGRGIAARFAAAGLSVLIGSRDPGRARETVDRLHGASSTLPVEGVSNEEVAARSDVVFLGLRVCFFFND